MKDIHLIMQIDKANELKSLNPPLAYAQRGKCTSKSYSRYVEQGFQLLDQQPFLIADITPIELL